MNSPRPSPAKPLVPDACPKRSKIFPMSSGAMPMPWSSTSMSAPSGHLATRIVTGCPPPYLSAFDKRLVSTCSSRKPVPHAHKRFAAHNVERAARFDGRRLEPLRNLQGKRLHVDAFPVQLQLLVSKPRHVKQPINKRHHSLRLPLDDRKRALEVLGRERPRPKLSPGVFHPQLQRRKRRPHLVRRNRQKLLPNDDVTLRLRKKAGVVHPGGGEVEELVDGDGPLVHRVFENYDPDGALT